MAYNTGNDLGSTDPRDLSDNSSNFDRAINDTSSPTWTDRFGNLRATIANQLGYNFKGDYAAGIELTSYTDIIRYSGEFYGPAASATLPYTTTATLPDADSNLVSRGDQVIRQVLALTTAGNGSDLVGHTGTSDTVTEALDNRPIFVGSVADLSGITFPVDNQTAIVSGSEAGIFEYNASGSAWERRPEYYDNSTSGLSAVNQQEAIDELSSTKITDFLPAVSEQVTVGAGGDYSTINEALAYFSSKYPSYKSGGVYGEILLLSGFVVAEEVHLINGIDLGWVRISSQDAEVTITRSAITTPFVDYEPIVNVPLSSDRRACFYALNNSTLPQINALFNMDSSGAQANVYGISVQWNSAVTVSEFCGVKNADRGIEVQVNSVGNCFKADFTGSVEVGARVGNNSQLYGDTMDVSSSALGVSAGFGTTAHVQNLIADACGKCISADNSTVLAAQAVLTNATIDAVTLNGSFNVLLDDADLSNSAGRGLYIISGSSGTCSAVGVTIDSSTGNGVEVYTSTLNLDSATITNSGARGIEASDGAKLNAFGATVTGSGTTDLVILRGSQIIITTGQTTSGGGSPAVGDTNVAAFNAIDGNRGIIWN